MLPAQLTQRIPGVYCLQTSKAIERLKQGKPGDTVTREVMATIIGRECSPNGTGYSNVATAIRRVEQEDRIVWRWDRTVKAWKCLDSSERVKESKGCLKSSHRKARKAIIVNVAVDITQLGPEDRKQHELNQALAGMTYVASGRQFRDRLARSDVAQLKEPDPQKLIELMRNGKVI